MLVKEEEEEGRSCMPYLEMRPIVQCQACNVIDLPVMFGIQTAAEITLGELKQPLHFCITLV